MTLEEIMNIVVDNSDPEKRREENHSYYALFKDSMEVCTKDPEDEYFYTIYKTGEATKHEKRSGICIGTDYATSMLRPCEDYVMYSTTPIVKAGYLIFDKRVVSVKRLLSDIFDSAVLDGKDLDFVSMTPQSSDKVVRIEVEKGPYRIVMCTILELVKLNTDRRMVEIKSLPYMKSVDNKGAIYVYITKESRLHNYIGSEDRIKTGNIIHDIVDGCKELYPEINMKWKGLSTRYLFY